MRTVHGLFIAAIAACSHVVALAQEETTPADTSTATPWISVTGAASVTSDFYEHSSDPTGAQAGRRPAALHRLVFTPTINIAGLLSLPLTLMVTYPETNTTTPSITAPSLAELFANPANALGLSSFSPKIGWAQLHLGSYTPQMSELSGGDLQIFGAGFDLTPGSVQLSASRGISQRAVEPDADRNVGGSYRRDMTMARIAFGNPDSTSVGVNVVYAKDDPTSITNTVTSILPARPAEDDSSVVIPSDTLRLRAEEGAIASINTKVVLGQALTFSAEGALSIFTRDQRSNLVDPADNPASFLFDARTSTRIDGAGSASLSMRYSTWGVTVSGLYMGAGFQPLAYPFIQTDRLDLKVSPMLNLFNGDFTLSGTIGQRVNNLSETKGEAMTQTIANGQMSLRFSDVFSLSSSYSNFGMRNNRQNPLDSQRIQNVSESFSIDPMLTFTIGSVMHTVTASIGIDRFDDFNVVSGVESSNNTRSAVLAYTGILEAIPLTIGANTSRVENILTNGTLKVESYGVNASYRLLAGQLVPTLSMTLANSRFGSTPSDIQTFLRAGMRWRATKNLVLLANYGVSSYTYGTATTKGTGFTEQTLQLSVNTTF
jgi:hypothetical protein